MVSPLDSGGSTVPEDIVYSDGVTEIGGLDGGEFGSVTSVATCAGNCSRNITLLCFTAFCGQINILR